MSNAVRRKNIDSFSSEIDQAPLPRQVRRRLAREARSPGAGESQIRTRGGESPSHGFVSVDDSEHERGKTELGREVGICARLDEHAHGVEMSTERGPHESRLTEAVLRVRISPGEYLRAKRGGVAFLRRALPRAKKSIRRSVKRSKNWLS